MDANTGPGSGLVPHVRHGSIAFGAVLGLALLAMAFAPAVSAHNEITLHVSQAVASAESNPSIAFGPRGQVYAAYGQDSGGGVRDIVVRADQDGWVADGAPVFTTSVVANDAAGRATWGILQNVPLVVDRAGAVYVAWTDTRNLAATGTDIRVARSDDNGSAFQASVRVSDDNSVNLEQHPSLAVGPSGNLYCAYMMNRGGGAALQDIWFSKSTDRGQTWSPSVRVNDITGTNDQVVPRIAVDSQERIFVTWTDNGPTSRVLVDVSTDYGATWGTDHPFGTSGANAALSDVGAGGDGVVYLVWLDRRMGDAGVFFARSTDHGASWAPEMRLNAYPNNAPRIVPKVAVGPAGLVYVVWNNGPAPTGLTVARLTSDGSVWVSNTGLAGNSATGNPADPVIFSTGIDPSWNFFYIWCHDDGAPNGLEIYARWIDPAPQPPAGVSAVKGGTAGSAVVSWAANTELDLGGYNVYREGPSSAYVLVATLPAASVSWTDGGRWNGTWTYYVSAFDRFGHESGTNWASVTLGLTTDDRINNLQNQLSNLQTNVTNLQNQNGDLETDLHNANASLGDLKGQLSSSQTLNVILLILVVVLSLVILGLSLRGRKGGTPAAAQPAMMYQPPSQGPPPP